MLKRLVLLLLIKKTQGLLTRFHPTVIAVTGSVGKTSTRHAIATVLEGSFSIRSPKENYNNEFGTPLAILGEKSPGSSPLGWLRVLLRHHNTFPKMLVLEFGADHPGDITELCRLFSPSVGVVTVISPVHVENYASLEELTQEKQELVKAIPASGFVVLNADDARVLGMREVSKAPVRTYGFSEAADLRGEQESLRFHGEGSFESHEVFVTTSFTCVDGQDSMAVELVNTVGKSQISAALAALSVGKHFGISFSTMVERLKVYRPTPGRLTLLPGIKGTLLLDDSYNAAPASMAAGLHVLQSCKPRELARRIAALGSMAELGALSEEEHHLLGLRVAEAGVDLLVCVGEPARTTLRAAKEAGVGEAHWFATSEEAGRFLDQEVKQGDILFVKGSQGTRMEKVVKELMRDPLQAEKLLVRQYGKWVRG